MNPPSRLLTAILFVSIAVLPLNFQPLRLEGHEPHRAGLLLVLVLLALPLIRWPKRNLLSVAIVGWCLALTLATIFSLTPARSFFGDSIRRMGLVTGLALAAGAFLGAQLHPRAAGRWFWLAGVTVSGYVMLQALGWLPNPLNERPFGLLGAPAYTGGWLALAVIWAGCGGWPEQRARRWGYGAGLVLMGAALLLTGARGSLLALCAGLAALLLLWTAVHRARRTAFIIVIVTIVSLAGWFSLSRADWSTSPLAHIPLIARLNPNQIDSSRISRELIAHNALTITAAWPSLTALNGTAASNQALRPVIGYGLDTFELLHRPLLTLELRQHEGDRPVDRAHNDWLDTLVTMGWFGVVARLCVWLGATWLGLRRLGLNHGAGWACGALGVCVAALLTANSPYFPAALTFGAWVGLGVGLLLYACFRPVKSEQTSLDNRWERRSIYLALAVLAAHITDLQFSFTTVAAAWPMWLALGLLLRPANAVEEQPPPKSFYAHWLALAGGLLIRGLLLAGAAPPAVIGLLGMIIVAAWVILPIAPSAWPLIGLFWIGGLVASANTRPEAAALWDAIFIAGGLVLLARPVQFTRRTRLFAYGVLALLLFSLWGYDIAVDIHYGDSFKRFGEASADSIQTAAVRRPYDDRLLTAAANIALNLSSSARNPPDVKWLTIAHDNLERAGALNPYDAHIAYLLAVMESQTALVADDWEAHLQWANDYYAAAVRLSPAEPYLWREWSRFSLDLRGDSLVAAGQARAALRLDPADADAQSLLQRATSTQP